MVRITAPAIAGGIGRAREAGPGRAVGGTAFAGYLGGSAMAATAGTVSPASLGSLLTLQEAPLDGRERRRRSARRGDRLLDDLEALHGAVMDGRSAVAPLDRLASELAMRCDAGRDPELDALLAEIEVRAAVELAKSERSG